MGLDIVSNQMATDASNALTSNQADMQDTLEKLSSGHQINNAADDASGLVISQHLQAQIGAFTQAQSNTQAGINVVQTAGGALSEVNTILQRVNTLAVEAQNGSAQDSTAQQAAQSEVTQALQSIIDIAGTTVYGSKQLLTNGTNANVNYTFQTGWDGTAASQVSFSVSALNLANLGLVNNTLTGTGDGIGAVVGNVTTGVHNLLVTAATVASYTQTALPVTVAGTFAINFGGTSYTVTTTAGESAANQVIAINGATNASGALLSAVATAATATLGVSITASTAGAGAFTFGSATPAGATDVTAITTGATSVTGLDAQVSLDGGTATDVTAAQNVVGGTFAVTSPTGTSIAATLTGALSAGTDVVSQSYAAGTQDLNNFQIGSATAISTVQAAIATVSGMQGQLGAQQNELQDISDNETTGISNLTAANSSIADTNMAASMVQFTQDQVLVQAGVSMLAQANQMPQYVLKLLG
jgi:flagellin